MLTLVEQPGHKIPDCFIIVCNRYPHTETAFPIVTALRSVCGQFYALKSATS